MPPRVSQHVYTISRSYLWLTNLLNKYYRLGIWRNKLVFISLTEALVDAGTIKSRLSACIWEILYILHPQKSSRMRKEVLFFLVAWTNPNTMAHSTQSLSPTALPIIERLSGSIWQAFLLMRHRYFSRDPRKKLYLTPHCLIPMSLNLSRRKFSLNWVPLKLQRLGQSLSHEIQLSVSQHSRSSSELRVSSLTLVYS